MMCYSPAEVMSVDRSMMSFGRIQNQLFANYFGPGNVRVPCSSDLIASHLIVKVGLDYDLPIFGFFLFMLIAVFE